MLPNQIARPSDCFIAWEYIQYITKSDFVFVFIFADVTHVPPDRQDPL